MLLMNSERDQTGVGHVHDVGHDPSGAGDYVRRRTMSTDNVANAKGIAEDALMARLEEWAASLGPGGVKRSDGARYFPSRQMTQMRAAHANGELLNALTYWLPGWEFKQDRYTARMVEIMDCGLPVWEEIVASTGDVWSPFVTDEQRRALLAVVARVRADGRR